MPTTYDLASRDARTRLEEFSDEFQAALVLGGIDEWAAALGLSRTSDALRTTFPIPLSAAGYHEFKGEMKYRSLYQRSLHMKTKPWQDGVDMPVREIEQEFVSWDTQPAEMAQEWLRLPNEMAASMLAENSSAGPNLDVYVDKDSGTDPARKLFAADHPFNVLDASVGTFDNRLTTTVAEVESGTFFDALNAHFRTIKGPNGKDLGLSASGGTLLVPGLYENLFKHTLMQDTIVRTIQEGGANVAAVTQSNLYKGTLGYRVGIELQSDSYFYAIAGGRPGLHPWVIQKTAAVEEFMHDKSSDYYKRTLRVALSYVGDANIAAALPHRIVRVAIS